MQRHKQPPPEKPCVYNPSNAEHTLAPAIMSSRLRVGRLRTGRLRVGRLSIGRISIGRALLGIKVAHDAGLLEKIDRRGFTIAKIEGSSKRSGRGMFAKEPAHE